MPVNCTHDFQFCRHGKCALDCCNPDCEPSLEHEYYCNCAEIGCQRSPCSGRCGCTGCRRAYVDASGGPE